MSKDKLTFNGDFDWLKKSKELTTKGVSFFIHCVYINGNAVSFSFILE